MARSIRDAYWPSSALAEIASAETARSPDAKGGPCHVPVFVWRLPGSGGAAEYSLSAWAGRVPDG
jgi:hypothetical protein